MSEDSLKITAITPENAAKILSAAYSRRVTEKQVRQVAEDGGLLRADGTFSLLEYLAFLVEKASSPKAGDQ